MGTHLKMAACILFPLIAGLWLMLQKTLHDARKLKYYVCLVLLINIILTGCLMLLPDTSWIVWKLTDKLNIVLRLDSLSRIFLILVSVIWLVVSYYAHEYMEHEDDPARFFAFYLMTLSGLTGLCLAGNFMTLYLFFEAMSLLSVPLVLHTMSKKAIAAALKYLIYSIAGASLALIGFFIMLYYGSIEFAAGGTLSPEVIAAHQNILLAGAMFTIVGFGTKAGIFPMHSWLPAAHPVAPAPASAVLSGVITKAGILAVIRVVYYQFGVTLIKGSWVQYVWIALSLISVLMGSTLAYKEQVLKKRLAYSSVSQLGYILFGLATLTPAGFIGAVMHVVCHSVIKNGLFLGAGAVIHQTHKTKVSELAGIGKRMPVTMVCFTICALALVGIPPTGGFVSKWNLISGSLESGLGFISWLGPVVLLVSAILTAGYLLGISVKAFIIGKDQEEVTAEPEGTMMKDTQILLAFMAVVLGICAGPLISYLNTIAGGLF